VLVATRLLSRQDQGRRGALKRSGLQLSHFFATTVVPLPWAVSISN
jgi:hypothetical protein